MVVRGAPAIGCVSAYAIALAAAAKKFKSLEEQQLFLEKASGGLFHARPTAVNLRWALTSMQRYLAPLAVSDRADAAWSKAKQMAGVQNPPRGIVVYIFLFLYAFAADLNDIAKAP